MLQTPPSPETEETIVRQSLTDLDAIEHPSNFASYESQRAFEIRHKAFWLVYLLGIHWFLKWDTEISKLDEVGKSLVTETADREPVRKQLEGLWLSTKHQKMGYSEYKQMLELYTERLVTYPPSHVSYVLRNLSRTATFFPALAEIEQELRDYLPYRSTLLSALRRARKKLKEQL